VDLDAAPVRDGGGPVGKVGDVDLEDAVAVLGHPYPGRGGVPGAKVAEQARSAGVGRRVAGPGASNGRGY